MREAHESDSIREYTKITSYSLAESKGQAGLLRSLSEENRRGRQVSNGQIVL